LSPTATSALENSTDEIANSRTRSNNPQLRRQCSGRWTCVSGLEQAEAL
jgi:hypothetical protein